MHKLLTKGIGHTTFKTTNIGRIPEDWQVIKLSEISSEIIGGGTPSTKNPDYWNGNIHWMRSVSIKGRYITNGERLITKLGLDNSSTHLIPRNNLILATRVSIGNVAINKIDIAISQDLSGIIINTSKAHVEYLYWVFLKLGDILKSFTQGTTIQGLTREVVTNIDIALPSLSEQQKIAFILSNIDDRFLIRNSYEGPGQSLKVDGKKVQQLIDDHVRALDIAELMDQREVTYKRFLDYTAKFETERARTALVKNKARQIIRELAPTNPVYYEKLRERLEKIIEEEEQRRKDDASYFNKLAKLYNEAINADEERKKLGFSTKFEFAVYELLQSLKSNEKVSKDITNAIYAKVKEEAEIVGWKNKRSSEKKMSIAIYDILSENGYPEDKINEITMQIIDLAKHDL